MPRPYASAYAAARAHAGSRKVRDINHYADRLIKAGILVRAPASKRAIRAGSGAVRAEQWRDHRWILQTRSES